MFHSSSLSDLLECFPDQPHPDQPQWFDQPQQQEPQQQVQQFAEQQFAEQQFAEQQQRAQQQAQHLAPLQVREGWQNACATACSISRTFI